MMFLIDDILLSPVHSILWIFKEINHAVEAERANEAETITAKLSELYMMLETGQMTEAEFDAAEKVLLDRLDALKASDSGAEEEEEEEAATEEVTEEEEEEEEEKVLTKTRPPFGRG